MTPRRLGLLDNFLLFIILTLSFSPLRFPLYRHITFSSEQSSHVSLTRAKVFPLTPKTVKTHQLFIKNVLMKQLVVQLDQHNSYFSVGPQYVIEQSLLRWLGEECIPELSAMPGRVVRVARVVIKHFDLVTRCLLNYEWL